MLFEENKVKDIQIAYIGGGSRGWAWGFMSDLAVEKQMSGTVRLYDIDHQSAKNNALIGNRLIEENPELTKWQYDYADSLETALTGADFVVISILPGTFDDMDVDVHTPEKYGIYQSVGDSIGPGGLFRALRTIPQYVTIAEAIKTFAPDSWVINYTNPMSICTRTLYRIFPEIKAIGNCHEVFGTQKLLASALKEVKGIEGVKREDIKVNVLGINHFTWIDKAFYKGMDLMPIYDEFVNRFYDEGYEGDKTGNWMNDHFASANRIKFDLYRRYGIIAAAGDRHLAEFCPNNWYLGNPDMVKQWKFGLTPVSWRKEHDLERRTKAEQILKGEKPLPIEETGEEGVKQIKALVGLGDLLTNVNIPNTGQMPELPLGAVVETNALFQKDSLTPIQAGRLPSAVQTMVARHVANQESVVEAGLTGDKELAFRTFLNDPLVNLSLEDARECFEAMYR